jgi:hypothetical protein
MKLLSRKVIDPFAPVAVLPLPSRRLEETQL